MRQLRRKVERLERVAWLKAVCRRAARRASHNYVEDGSQMGARFPGAALVCGRQLQSRARINAIRSGLLDDGVVDTFRQVRAIGGGRLRRRLGSRPKRLTQRIATPLHENLARVRFPMQGD
jgi:hypothetical protein